MSGVHHACVYCYYNSCHGNAAEWFSALCDNDYRTICILYCCHGNPVKGFLVLLIALLNVLIPLEVKMETCRHSTGSQFNVIF
jgi:hypothetical protein